MGNEDNLPGPLKAELTRLRAEREVYTAERDRLRAELAEAEAKLAEVTTERDELAETLNGERSAEHLAALTRRAEEAEAEAREKSAEADAQRQETAAARAERDTLRAELADTRGERDRLRLTLLDAELSLAGQPMPVRRAPAGPEADERAARLAAEVAELSNELEATRATISWRVTAPLRAVRKRTAR
ncbi:hypothetical protein [Amycolatopsis albispora]|uniref:Chromosome partition protein Smc n=1 Tax=Amycolatopsis albispora TaxID=1804986 RepID=A0A344LD55_9PSEU|nr:hypothetical protein [Amycolatopsis albispora]AXB45979.1 hypothetical protein A4R43_28765 [Amycolatopsis albispora]